jgi:hypothetical protein
MVEGSRVGGGVGWAEATRMLMVGVEVVPPVVVSAGFWRRVFSGKMDCCSSSLSTEVISCGVRAPR